MYLFYFDHDSTDLVLNVTINTFFCIIKSLLRLRKIVIVDARLEQNNKWILINNDFLERLRLVLSRSRDMNWDCFEIVRKSEIFENHRFRFWLFWVDIFSHSKSHDDVFYFRYSEVVCRRRQSRDYHLSRDDSRYEVLHLNNAFREIVNENN